MGSGLQTFPVSSLLYLGQDGAHRLKVHTVLWVVLCNDTVQKVMGFLANHKLLKSVCARYAYSAESHVCLMYVL